MYYPTRPVSWEICTRALQTCSSLCQLDLRLLPGSHGAFLPHTFCPSTSRGITMKGERSGCQSWSESRDCSKILNLRFSAHIPWSLWRHHIQAATHSTDEGTRYHVINTRMHRCWRFRRLEENSKSNPFHHTAPERTQIYLCCFQLILKQHLVMLKSWKSKFSNLFHCFNLIIAEPTTCHLAGHRHGERCFTRALWH